MEKLKQINFVVFGENILPEVFKEKEMLNPSVLDIKCSIENKQNFTLSLYYMTLTSANHTSLVRYLNRFDFNLAIFVCDLLDEKSIDKLKNFKFVLPEDDTQSFVDLKDYIAKKTLFPVVIGYIKDDSKKAQLEEEDVMSFAQELKGATRFEVA